MRCVACFVDFLGHKVQFDSDYRVEDGASPFFFFSGKQSF